MVTMTRYTLFIENLRKDLDLYRRDIQSQHSFFADLSRFRMAHLESNVLKKYVGDGYQSLAGSVSEEQAHNACWSALKAANECAREFDLQDVLNRNPDVASILSMARDHLHRWLNVIEEEEDGSLSAACDFKSLALNLDVGPGSSLGCKDTSYWHKLLAGCPTYYAAKPHTAVLYNGLLSMRSRSAVEAERIRLQQFGPYKAVDCSQFNTVPKSSSKRRGIATEATLPMAIQLAIGALISTRLLKATGIDTSNQTLNQDLARIGSSFGTLATIDFSAASDYRFLEVDKYLLPADWYGWIEAVRAPCIHDQKSGETIELAITSTMGNGYTFALMTLVNVAILYATYDWLNIQVVKPHSSGCNLAVFGDDIIVVTEAVPLVYKVFETLGYRINHDKSYVTGPFRESCGADWYQGEPVRPFQVESLDEEQDVLVALNLITIWTTISGIPLPHTYEALRKLVPEAPYVPPSESLDAGIMVPANVARKLRAEGAIPSVSRKVRSKMENDFQGSAYLHRKMRVPKQMVIKVGKDGYYVGEQDARHLMAVLHGCMQQGRVSVRMKRAEYDLRWKETSSWDLSPLRWASQKGRHISSAGRFWGLPIGPIAREWIDSSHTFYGDLMSPV